MKAWRSRLPETSPADTRIDRSLTLLLVIQGLTMFVVIPFGMRLAGGRMLFDVCHLAFAAVCVFVLTRHRLVQAALVIAMLLLVVGPALLDGLAARLSFGTSLWFTAVAAVAFVFNALVTAVVALHVFGRGRVTKHRVRGAVLLYLNVAALFSIAYSALDTIAPGAIAPSGGGSLPEGIAAHTAALSYFSFTTITTTGFGDLVPVHPVARTLANLESVFGHLFPATLLARLVALHVAHDGEATPTVIVAPEGGTSDNHAPPMVPVDADMLR